MEGLSIGAVAISAGMSKSGVFAHSASRSNCSWRCSSRWGPVSWSRQEPLLCANPVGCRGCGKMADRWCEWSRVHRSGCVYSALRWSTTAAAMGAIREHVLRQQAGWRDELRRTIRLAVEAGHLRTDTDTTQARVSEIYSLMLPAS